MFHHRSTSSNPPPAKRSTLLKMTTPRPHATARYGALMAVVIAVIAALGTAAGPAHAVPIGPCDGACSTQTVPAPPPPPPAQKLVTVYHSTHAYSTPYLNARSRHPLTPATYVAICEANSGSRGPYSNPWWTRLRNGTWVNNGDLRGGAKMGIGDCPAPANDGASQPRGGRQGCDDCSVPAPQPPLPPAAKQPKLHVVLMRCDPSAWVSAAGRAGSGAALVVEMLPTSLARTSPNVKKIWRDLNRCVAFPRLAKSVRRSLYKQLACHAVYGRSPVLGGFRWGLEAKRPDVPWIVALDPRNKCNWKVWR